DGDERRYHRIETEASRSAAVRGRSQLSRAQAAGVPRLSRIKWRSLGRSKPFSQGTCPVTSHWAPTRTRYPATVSGRRSRPHTTEYTAPPGARSAGVESRRRAPSVKSGSAPKPGKL